MKSKKIFLIMLTIILSICLLSFTGCEDKKEIEKDFDEIETSEETEEKDENDFVPAHKKIGLSDGVVEFDGILYCKKDYESDEIISVPVKDVLDDDGVIASTGGSFYSTYYFSEDINFWQSLDNSQYIEEFIKIMGKPTTIYEDVTLGTSEYFSGIELIWECDDIYIEIGAYHYFSDGSIEPHFVMVHHKDKGIKSWKIDGGTKYGKDIKISS